MDLEHTSWRSKRPRRVDSKWIYGSLKNQILIDCYMHDCAYVCMYCIVLYILSQQSTTSRRLTTAVTIHMYILNNQHLLSKEPTQYIERVLPRFTTKRSVSQRQSVTGPASNLNLAKGMRLVCTYCMYSTYIHTTA